MVNSISKDKVDFLVQVGTIFISCDQRARPRYEDADSANLRAISGDSKQKSFERVKKIHMLNFSVLIQIYRI